MARGVGGFKETFMPNSLGGVPSELLQVLIFACTGKGARFGCWLAHVHACWQKFEKMAAVSTAQNN